MDPRSPRRRREKSRKALRAIGLLGALLVTGPAQAANLTRGPYLQLLTTRSVTIAWSTDAPATCGVRVGPVGGAQTVVAGSIGSACAIPVGGLAPGTAYAYTPLADDVAVDAESVFQTDEPTLPWTMLVFGDSGGGNAKQAAVRDAMLRSPADVIVHTGDMVYENGEPENYDPRFFEPYRDLIRRLDVWPCAGNHDVITASGQPWRDAFITPANNAAHNEQYYSFDFGNAHVTVLDSNASTSPGSAQYKFLDQDLAATTALWKLVVLHHTLFSNGSSGGNPTLRTNLVPLFDAHGVDLVLAGHDHDYERTLPMVNGQVVAPGSGTVYVTTGGGGDSIRGVGTSAFTAYSESAFHFTRLTEGGGWLLLQMIRDDGAVRDSMTLTKGGVPPAPRCGDGLVNQPGEQCDGADHPACAAGCAADCTCLPRCGDGTVNQASESCDGRSDIACPGLCLGPTCSCGAPDQIVTLTPVADTFIESGTQATWDHGIANQLNVDEKPGDLTYLRFDLGAVTRPVTAATLTLYCTNASSDGGTVYPVYDSSWIEGTQTGRDASSAGGPGITWSQVDTNGDGTIDTLDTSPWVPDVTTDGATLGIVAAGQSYTTDVTPFFQGGPGLYSVAVRSASDNGAAYASREATNVAQRPQLRLELAPSLTTTTSSSTTTSTSTTTTTSTSTTTTTSTSSSSSSSTTSTSTSTAPTTTTSSTTTSSSTSSTTATTATPTTSSTSTTSTSSTSSTSTSASSTSSSSTSTSTSTTAPSPPPATSTTIPLVVAVQADVTVSERLPGLPLGTMSTLQVSNKPGKRLRTFFRVAVSGVGTRSIVDAQLRLQASGVSGFGQTGGRLAQITSCGWDERRVTWITQPAIDGASLATAGPVRRGDIVRFDVGRAIVGDGVYCFALDITNPDVVTYTAREGLGRAPDVVIDLGPSRAP
jgi:predicted phosphodiesterase